MLMAKSLATVVVMATLILGACAKARHVVAVPVSAEPSPGAAAPPPPTAARPPAARPPLPPPRDLELEREAPGSTAAAPSPNVPAATPAAGAPPVRAGRKPRSAPLPTAAVTPPVNDPFAWAKAYRDGMTRTSASFSANPPRTQVGREIDVELTVSPASEAALRQKAQATGALVVTGEARIQPRMRAQLVVPDGATVAGAQLEDRLVLPDTPITWKWKVTPTREGELPMTARLVAPVMVGDKETSFEVSTFDATVTVFVAPSTRVSDFFSGNWKWLFSTLIVPLAGWWWKRRSAQAASPNDSRPAPSA
jgi:hypothetical protein